MNTATQFELTQRLIKAAESFTETDRTLTSIITEGYMTLESYDFGVFLTTGYSVVPTSSRSRYWNTCRKILERIPGYKDLPYSYQLLNRDKTAPIIGAKTKKVAVEAVAVEAAPITLESIILMIDSLSNEDRESIVAYLTTTTTTTATTTATAAAAAASKRRSKKAA